MSAPMKAIAPFKYRYLVGWFGTARKNGIAYGRWIGELDRLIEDIEHIKQLEEVIRKENELENVSIFSFQLLKELWER